MSIITLLQHMGLTLESIENGKLSLTGWKGLNEEQKKYALTLVVRNKTVIMEELQRLRSPLPEHTQEEIVETKLKPDACRQRLTSPDQAGAATWEALYIWKVDYTHLRPCPQTKNKKGDWRWIDRGKCKGCPWLITEETTLQ